MIPWLLEGKGDVIAASMTSNEQRKEQGVKFSSPYLTASEIIVARADEPEQRLTSVEDLQVEQSSFVEAVPIGTH